MGCSMKSMLKAGLGIVAVAGTAYVLFPQFRELIIALASTMVFLLCPLSMLFCMKMMKDRNGQGDQSSAAKEPNGEQVANRSLHADPEVKTH
jgi:hypothetical protein